MSGAGVYTFLLLRELLNQPSQQEVVADEVQQPMQDEGIDAQNRQGAQSVPHGTVVEPQPHGMIAQQQRATGKVRS